MPVVALSAGVLQEEKDSCAAAGMDDFLAKPVDGTMLRRVLLHWLPASVRPREAAAVEAAPRPPVTVPTEAKDDAVPAVLDLAIYHELFGGITDDVRSLLDAFVNNAQELMADLRRLEAARDAAGLGRTAHRFAGAALSAGAAELGAACRALEYGIKGDTEWTKVARLMTAIDTAWSRAQGEISSV
jgi:HPt (histidine-containing phosphotransfer) domain-containing protein